MSEDEIHAVLHFEERERADTQDDQSTWYHRGPAQLRDARVAIADYSLGKAVFIRYLFYFIGLLEGTPRKGTRPGKIVPAGEGPDQAGHPQTHPIASNLWDSSLCVEDKFK